MVRKNKKRLQRQRVTVFLIGGSSGHIIFDIKNDKIDKYLKHVDDINGRDIYKIKSEMKNSLMKYLKSTGTIVKIAIINDNKLEISKTSIDNLEQINEKINLEKAKINVNKAQTKLQKAKNNKNPKIIEQAQTALNEAESSSQSATTILNYVESESKSKEDFKQTENDLEVLNKEAIQAANKLTQAKLTDDSELIKKATKEANNATKKVQKTKDTIIKIKNDKKELEILDIKIKEDTKKSNEAQTLLDKADKNRKPFENELKWAEDERTRTKNALREAKKEKNEFAIDAAYEMIKNTDKNVEEAQKNLSDMDKEQEPQVKVAQDILAKIQESQDAVSIKNPLAAEIFKKDIPIIVEIDHKTFKNKSLSGYQHIHKKSGGKGKKIRKHQGIDNITGRLNKGYKYSGKRLKSGLSEIIKTK